EADDYSIEYLDVEGVKAVTLQGRAATDQSLALNALKDESGLDSDEASDIIDDVFEAGETDPEYPSRDEDGTQIENVSIKWVTEDTVDDGDPNLLSIIPADDSKQSVRLRVSYALSGEFDYQPGDITVTIPASIFKGRNGEDLGKVVIPYAQYPSTKNEFNYQLIDGNYVITNTRGMSAASKPFFEIAFTDLIPHTLVDELVSQPFSAYVMVKTHLGNTIALRTEELTAVFDTDVNVDNASKKAYDKPVRIDAAEVPEELRNKYPEEEEFIRVKWYMDSQITSNTLYDLKIEDFLSDEYEGFLLDATTDTGDQRRKDLRYR
ncbi:MAG: hypothetical protein IKF68_00830, partial [Erysipelotrichaceae bacterium]|nr:hypothetical protein [Erysipelotrichaceae bacterium]